MISLNFTRLVADFLKSTFGINTSSSYFDTVDNSYNTSGVLFVLQVAIHNSLLPILIVFTLLINIVAILVLFQQTPKTSTEWLMIGLTIANILQVISSFLSLIFVNMSFYETAESLLESEYLKPFLFIPSLLSQTMTIFIGFERIFAVFIPISFRKVWTPKKGLITVICAFLIAVFLSFVSFFTLSFSIVFVQELSTTTAVFVVAFCSIITVIGLSVKTLKTTYKNISRMKNEQKNSRFKLLNSAMSPSVTFLKDKMSLISKSMTSVSSILTLNDDSRIKRNLIAIQRKGKPEKLLMAKEKLRKQTKSIALQIAKTRLHGKRMKEGIKEKSQFLRNKRIAKSIAKSKRIIRKKIKLYLERKQTKFILGILIMFITCVSLVVVLSVVKVLKQIEMNVFNDIVIIGISTMSQISRLLYPALSCFVFMCLKKRYKKRCSEIVCCICKKYKERKIKVHFAMINIKRRKEKNTKNNS